MPTPKSIDGLSAKVEAIQADMAEIKSSLIGINSALIKLASLEAQHLDTKSAMTRAFNEIADTKRSHDDLERRIMDRSQLKDQQLQSIEVRMPQNLQARLTAIEIIMPGLIEMRKWIIAGVLSMVGLVGLALITIVIRTPGPALQPAATVVVPQQQSGESAPALRRPVWPHYD